MPALLPLLIFAMATACWSLLLCDIWSRHFGLKKGWLTPQLIVLAVYLLCFGLFLEGIARLWGTSGVLFGAVVYFGVKLGVPRLFAARRRKRWTDAF